MKNNKYTLLLALILIVSFIFLYLDVIIYLINKWSTDGNYSHGFFVPIIIGYIIWTKRKELMTISVVSFWPALLLVFLSGLLLIAGQLAVHGFSRNFSIVLMMFSLTLFILGKAWTRKLMIPLAFLIFMIPLPELFTRKVMGPLQLFSSYISVEILSFMNYTVLREGNIIQLPNCTLSVAEACSGLRSLVALTFLAAIAGYFVLKSNRKRLILFLCAFPIAIILNWARITGTVLLANHWGVEAALGFFHNFSGLIIFGVATILISSIMLFLKRIEGLTTSSQTSDVATVPTESSIKISALIASSCVLILLSVYGNFLFSLKPGPSMDLQSLPLKISPYEGKEMSIDPAVTDFSSVTQDRSISFFMSNKPPIGLYLGYYRTSRELKGFFHGSDVCLPGSGWQIIKKEKYALQFPSHNSGEVEVLKYVSTKMGATQVLLTWVQAGHRIGTDTRIARLKFLWDTIVSFRYNDVTKVMIQTTLASQESEELATERLTQFTKLFYPYFIDVIT